MFATLQIALILLILLQVKHMLADFFLQTPRMLSDRARYLHFGRSEHAALHGFFSIIVFLVIGAPPLFTLALCAAEILVHFHIDWIKGRYSERTGETPAEPRFWRTFGLDQLAHQLTYVAMIWVWAAYTI